MEPIHNRYEFVLFFDVVNGNPNGDPDAGNMPRRDPETDHGIVTDVCIKRKIRDYVLETQEGTAGYDIYIQNNSSLNSKDDLALDQAKKELKNRGESKPSGLQTGELARDFMCANYFDIRTFGAVLTRFSSGKFGKSQVRGPVQLTFAESLDRIQPRTISITRQAITTDADFKKGQQNTIGEKHIVPYAMYRCEGFVSARIAEKVTGFSEQDLELLFEALENLFEFDRAAGRGKMSVRGLVIFKHDSSLGNAPASMLFDAVERKKNSGVIVPTSINDYGPIIIHEDQIPEGITVDIRVAG